MTRKRPIRNGELSRVRIAKAKKRVVDAEHKLKAFEHKSEIISAKLERKVKLAGKKLNQIEVKESKKEW